MIPYTLIRSDRRTLAIHILPDACVEVRAPKSCPTATVEAFIRDKEPWILQKLELVKTLPQPLKCFLQVGDTLPYQGKELPVHSSENGKLRFDGTAFFLPSVLLSPDTDGEIIKDALTQLYKRMTLPLVNKKVPLYAEQLGVHPTAVKVSGATGRWGSCSGKNSLNFSWMLAAVDPLALDYVVVHELCHILEHNHSDRFWHLVGSILPDYPQRQALLRETEKRLQAWR